MTYSVNENCVTCRMCVSQCPANAFVEDGYGFVIDPDKCTECGICARLCRLGGITVSGKAPEPRPKNHEPIKIDCDLVVIGGGGSGLVAAVRASCMTGKKIVVLEKAKMPGGCAYYGGGFRIIGSKVNEEAGIQDTREEMVRTAVASTFWMLDPKLIGKSYYALGPFVDWLCELDIKVKNDIKVFHDQHGRPENVILVPPDGSRSNGRYVTTMMLAECKKRNIEVLTEHRAVKIIRDDAGKITGVVAEDPGGITSINCRACLLATGNWIGSPELTEKYAPKFNHNRPKTKSPHMLPTCTGDGIGLAEGVGGFVDHDILSARLFGPHIMAPGGGIDAFGCRYEVLLINKEGKRWVNEAKREWDAGSLLMSQTDCCGYSILDLGVMEEIYRHYQDGRGGGDGGPQIKPPPPNYLDIIDKALAKNSPHKKANTLEELAKKIGVDPQTLVDTVNHYNELCEKGMDEDFFKPAENLIPYKKPPYYAVEGSACSDGGFGGVLVNSKMEALDANRNTIEGLYAVGDNCCGWFINIFGEKQSMINDLSWAFSSGYLAGNSIADYLNQ